MKQELSEALDHTAAERDQLDAELAKEKASKRDCPDCGEVICADEASKHPLPCPYCERDLARKTTDQLLLLGVDLHKICSAAGIPQRLLVPLRCSLTGAWFGTGGHLLNPPARRHGGHLRRALVPLLLLLALVALVPGFHVRLNDAPA